MRHRQRRNRAQHAPPSLPSPMEEGCVRVCVCVCEAKRVYSSAKRARALALSRLARLSSSLARTHCARRVDAAG